MEIKLLKWPWNRLFSWSTNEDKVFKVVMEWAIVMSHLNCSGGSGELTEARPIWTKMLFDKY